MRASYTSLFLIGGLLLVGAGCSQATPTPAPTANNNTNAVVPVNTNTVRENDNQNTNLNSNVNTPTNTNTNTAVDDDSGKTKSFSVEASNFAFSLKEIKVKQGDRVRITVTNKGGFHDWKLDEFSLATKQLQADQSETIEFVADKRGTFEYYCSVGQHRAMGMKGNLIVE